MLKSSALKIRKLIYFDFQTRELTGVRNMSSRFAQYSTGYHDISYCCYKSYGIGCKVQPSRNYNISAKRESANLFFGGIALIASAVAAERVVDIYNSYQASSSNQTVSQKSGESFHQNSSSSTESNADTDTTTGSSWFARNFYDGGFEEKMSKREAALILGVRESATVERIKDAHRRILLLNHPDRGGSAFVAAKINEAKDILIKGKQ